MWQLCWIASWLVGLIRSRLTHSAAVTEAEKDGAAAALVQHEAIGADDVQKALRAGAEAAYRSAAADPGGLRAPSVLDRRDCQA